MFTTGQSPAANLPPFRLKGCHFRPHLSENLSVGAVNLQKNIFRQALIIQIICPKTIHLKCA